MDEKLNTLEEAIINEVAKFNEIEYSFIKDHLPYLVVKSRENTGIGMYINVLQWLLSLKNILHTFL